MTESTETVTLPAVLTRQEVAKHCRISTRTVLRMCQDGRLKGVRFGRAVRYRAADVAKLLQAAG
jgi:excisionase family DNA binding protein